MIELLGYITLYLLVGLVLLPFPMLVDRLAEKPFFGKTKLGLLGFVLIWPVINTLALFLIWAISWQEYKNYK